MSLTGKNIRHILIASAPENGLAELFSGYVQHYGNGDLQVSLSPANRNIPSHIREILHEDGIHAYSGNASGIGTSDISVELNDCSTPESRAAATHRYFRISLPETQNKAVWRTCREEMKRLAIAFVGEVRSSNTGTK